MALKAATANARSKALPKGKSAQPAACARPTAPAKPAPPKGAAKQAAGKAQAVPVVTAKHLATSIADEHQIPRKQADAVVASLIGLMTDHLKNGDRLRISGLGILEVKSRPARMGRNPATGEAIQIKASKKIAFRAAKELKASI
ncbi:MAG: HU family DNA-binding protein [Alphaproteobacteria bacterium]|nr:HU family DNA-binding protein [Alphaproteobacteria bacterium]